MSDQRITEAIKTGDFMKASTFEGKKYVIRLLKDEYNDQILPDPCYVREFDPEYLGRGHLLTTMDLDLAKKYDSREAALLEWSTTSLKAYTAVIE